MQAVLHFDALARIFFAVVLFACLTSGAHNHHEVEADRDTGAARSSAYRYNGKTLYALENEMAEKKAISVLKDSIELLSKGANLPSRTPFDDILPSILMESHLVPPRDKFIVAPNAIKHLQKKYVVYGAGIANNPSFENYMNYDLGADVYAFDCTVAGKRNWGTLKFYQWCIGTPKNLDSSSYAKDVVNKKLEFYTLGQLKAKLNHTHIDMLKIDIEGCEWDLLYEEIVRGKDEDLPTQLLFELHTEGADWRWVPEAIVKGKKRQQVDQLILDLYGRGYRVFHVEMNDGDNYCAEIGLYRV